MELWALVIYYLGVDTLCTICRQELFQETSMCRPYLGWCISGLIGLFLGTCKSFDHQDKTGL